MKLCHFTTSTLFILPLILFFIVLVQWFQVDSLKLNHIFLYSTAGFESESTAYKCCIFVVDGPEATLHINIIRDDLLQQRTAR